MASGEVKFPMIAYLAGLGKGEQRRILRPHREKGFDSSDEGASMATRALLDQELLRITLGELRAQAELPDDDCAHIPGFATLLRTSPAFVQYLNYYLYFGVRFAAGRISNPCSTKDDPPGADDEADCNETIVGLPSPPLCKDAWFDKQDVEEFLNEVVPGDQTDPVKKALAFLDDFVSTSEQEEGSLPVKTPAGDERNNVELWLRGLYFADHDGGHFEQLTDGLLQWARGRYNFYVRLEEKGYKRAWVEKWKRPDLDWQEGRWNANNPIAARCAIVDLYWLARILRAEVTPRGLVTYPKHSWLYLLAMRSPAREAHSKNEILRFEEVLRTVFAYACDVVQNAVEKAEDCEDRKTNPQDYPKLPDKTQFSWRAVYDEELEEMRKQRDEWRYDSGPSTKRHPQEVKDSEGWSRRIWTGEDVDNPVGIALSGGGIRSATFGLGVLQRLQELDLLRHLDYLSTVSGGGYIGAWLLGNVRRTRYWLSTMTSWSKSIDHLRRFSNYLAPHKGIMSADSWSMWGTWIRNAFLLQLTAFVALAFLLVSELWAKPVFEVIGQGSFTAAAQGALILLLTLIAVVLSFYLWQLSRPPARAKAELVAAAAKIKPRWFADWVHLSSTKLISKGDVLPIVAASLAWPASFLAAALLWGEALHAPQVGLHYSLLLLSSCRSWPVVLGVVIASLWLLAYSCLAITKTKMTARSLKLWSFLTALVGTTFFYLALCGLLRFYGEMVAGGGSGWGPSGAWLAFALGPPATVMAMTVAIVIFIGLLGRDSPDWTREWWTRYGAWIGMFGTGLAILAAAAVIAPLWLYEFVGAKWWKSVKLGVVVGWLGSVISGLLAGNSARTGNDGGRSSPVLQWVARIGGFLFIAGAVMLASTTVYVILCEIFLPTFDGSQYWQNLTDIARYAGKYEYQLVVIIALLLAMAWLFSWRFDLNTFSLNQFYRNRLVRCYLGATRWQPGKRRPHLFTGFDDGDDLPLAALRYSAEGFCDESFRGPFPIVNCSLNLGGSSDLAVHTRQSASFTLTPLSCGALRKRVGYAPTDGFSERVTLGQAIAVSGAAASPNMGYNTSPLVSFLLTLFNVRLGWWFPNPGKSKWDKTGPLSPFGLVLELFGLADEKKDFVNVSDGGHFENLGIYELIRRRTRVIIAVDAECDSDLAFGSLGNVVRICETDFGAKVNIDVSSIRKKGGSGSSFSHCAIGKITYSNGALGYLIYLKSSLTGDEDVGIAQYHSAHPAFPHESTADQFFSEDQFEAYRLLGYHIAERTFRGVENEPPELRAIAAKLFDLWVPSNSGGEAFLSHAKTFDDVWDRFRGNANLAALFDELTGSPGLLPAALNSDELCACMELIKLMENVFFDLRLEDCWEQPDNRGWAMLFSMWAKSPKFREAWDKVHHTYGIRFEYFCERNLGLKRDRPVVRV
jgi:hypothetical protein